MAPRSPGSTSRARPSAASLAELRRAGRRRARRQRRCSTPRRWARLPAEPRGASTGRAGPRWCAGPRTSPSTTEAFAALWLGAGPAPPTSRCPSESVTLAADDADAPEPTEPDGADDDDPGPDLTLRVQPRRGAAPPRLRRLRRRRARRGEPAHGRPAAGRRAPAVPSAPAVAAAPAGRPDLRRTVRRVAAHRRRAGPPAHHRAVRPAPPGRAAVRRERLDGALRPGAAALRSTPRWPAAARVEAFALGTRLTRVTRELATRDPDARPGAGRPRRCADWSGGTRLGEALRRVQRPVGRAGHGPGRRRRDPLRRLGPRRSRGARRADGPAAPGGAPGRLGEPAEGVARLRARWPGGWRRRCRTSTTSSRATRSARSRSWPHDRLAIDRGTDAPTMSEPRGAAR